MFNKIFLVWLPWLLMMSRPEFKILKKKAIKIKEKKVLEDECVQCIGIDVLEEGEAYVFNAAQQIFQPEPLFDKVYSMPMERLNLERKVGEGIFPVKRCTTTKERRKAQYDRYIQKCLDVLSDPTSPDYDEATLVILNYYRRIHGRLKYIKTRLKLEEAREDMREDYRFAAMALDRLCFIMFTFFILTCIFVIFFSPPYLFA